MISDVGKKEEAKFFNIRSRIKVFSIISNELLLLVVLGIFIFLWMGLGTIIWGILDSQQILNPSCQKQCYLAEGWSLRIFVIVLAVMIVVYIIFLIFMFKIKDAFSIRDELAFLCFYSIIMVIGMFINMAIPNTFWPSTPYVGFILAAQIVGAFVISIVWPLAFPIVMLLWEKMCTARDTDDVEPSTTTGEKGTVDKGTQKGTGKMTFEEILENVHGKEKFKQFLVREFSVENLMFFTEANYFLKLEDRNDIEETARSIFDTYVASGAPFEINVTNDIREQCDKTMQESITTTLFENAKSEVFKSMQSDSFPRFVKSKLYKEMLQEIQKEQTEKK